MSAWLAYLCALQGHVVRGVGVGTGRYDVVWADRCERCGARISGDAMARGSGSERGNA